MKFYFIAALSLSILLGACGKDTEPATPSPTEIEVQANKASKKGHFFNSPYTCTRKEERVSKQTGKTRIRVYKSHYHPQKGWRIDDRSSSVSLYTPDTRYDGVPTKSSNIGMLKQLAPSLTPEDIEGKGYIFVSAFPNTHMIPHISTNNLSKFKKKNCLPMSDTKMFEITYLDRVEVRGQ